ncbi:MAG: uracil-DNA glycosylase [Bdellovibrio sp. CG12_big_fil_rev_8_21_14_0_65_39_13]|nr:MAG: uracil-DNA glycosylase [Bdellovibrio sp. CG22_combo_CG10-13_8_21_14_all_39_27]PIQ59471.1 MAG: uracil-DNA glycosylase [Bdellovibrio sp. CG12_big_fil_rev_8_21_14_0_65_39_13]PIR36601.1 MAG: uracil-DNA glycosylase [Bdellovibrio sp. CG11_big_fil_rev_8_21_14_0_20_39_38]
MTACLKCRHYFATYNSLTPRGCKLFQFQTAQIPANVIKRETGEDCQEFEERVVRKNSEEKEKINFNDPKYWS